MRGATGVGHGEDLPRCLPRQAFAPEISYQTLDQRDHWNFTSGSYFPVEDSFREQLILARGNHSKSLVGENVRENKSILPGSTFG